MKTHIKLLALAGFFALAASTLSAQQQVTNIYQWYGNIGIGAQYPNQRLVVSGRVAKIDFSGFQKGRLAFYNNKGGRSLGYSVHGKTGYGWSWLFDDAQGNEYFRVDYPTGNANLHGRLIISNGHWGIHYMNPTHALMVNGSIRAKEIIVDTGWADDVFLQGYPLLSLAETESYILTNGRLPGIPSAREVQNKGVSIGETQAMLLRKIEELTLHQIEQEKRLKALEKENAALKSQIETIQSRQQER